MNPSTPKLSVTVAFVRKNHRGGKRAPEPPMKEGNIPRITRLMALAYKFQELVERGDVKDYADLARLGHVTRARMSQIMNLLNLAPDIQEEILFLPRTVKGCDPIGERNIRPITKILDWSRQRKLWGKLSCR